MGWTFGSQFFFISYLDISRHTDRFEAMLSYKELFLAAIIVSTSGLSVYFVVVVVGD